MRGREHPWIVRESEVVVGAEVDHLEVRADRDLSTLRRADDPLLLVQTALADRDDLLAERIEETLVHGWQGTAAPDYLRSSTFLIASMSSIGPNGFNR